MMRALWLAPLAVAILAPVGPRLLFAGRLSAVLAILAGLGCLAVPFFGAFFALSLDRTPSNSAAWRQARLAALFAAISPVLLVDFRSVVPMNVPAFSNLWQWILVCLGAGAVIVLYARLPQRVRPILPAAKMHRRTAYAVGAFLLLHFMNNVTAIDSIATHSAVLRALRVVYRNPFIEPLLLAAVALQLLSGVSLAQVGLHVPKSIFRSLQITSGFYLAIFLLTHDYAVLILGRLERHTDTNFLFASGGPHGLTASAGSAALMPYYFCGVLAVFVHAACAFHKRMRRNRPERAAQAAYWVMGSGMATAIVATLALCGAHFRP